jgi:ADP-ribose pyrophosphatase YjhB (NUDIX family)
VREGADALILDDHGDVLLVRRADDGRWAMPGGWVDSGETPAQAVVREVREETGLVVSEPRLLHTVRREASTHFVFGCRVDGGSLRASEESVEVAFKAPECFSDWHADHQERLAAALNVLRGRCASFPSERHAAAAQTAVGFLSLVEGVEAVTLVGSCARRADANDLDLSVLVPNKDVGEAVVAAFSAFAADSVEIGALAASGPFAEVDVGWFTGEFIPGPRGWTTGPDDLEVAVGNELVYSKPLWLGNRRYDDLRARWLPYYDEDLRRSRLTEARMYAINDLDHVPVMVARDEPFHAFHRLYLGFQGFLQALFIARRAYPISYDKWIQEQIEQMLGLPDLYQELPSLIGIERLDSHRLAQSAVRLRELLDLWAQERA